MANRKSKPILGVLALGLVLMAAGCGGSEDPFSVDQFRPQINLSAAPQQLDEVFYAVRLQWFSWDTDGRVEYYIYSVDPPAFGDTVWTEISRNEVTLFFESRTPFDDTPEDPLPIIGSITSKDFHVFVIKAVDNEGLRSPRVFRAFTSFTVAPQSGILSPSPSRLLDAITAPSVLVQWSGTDVDGVLTQEPVLYKYKLASITTIQQVLGLGGAGPNPADLQKFFEADALTNFSSWDSVPPDSAFKQLEGLTPGQKWYFAVTSFDEAGAYEPRFLLDSNLLQFRPSTALQAPRITVFNSFFSRAQATGGIDLNERRVIKIEVPADTPIEFNWIAVAGAPGTLVTGYRWVLDPRDGDIFDETPRTTDMDYDRWSSWSLSEVKWLTPPFPAQPGAEVFRRFYVEARDNVGSISLVVIELRVIQPTFENEILVFDDFEGPTDRLPSLQPFGSFPTEAVLDTLMYAKGGVPYQARPPGTLSDPGMFVGFEYDTLDYRFFPFEGLPLSIVTDYKMVVWMIAAEDGGRRGGKFTSRDPMAALRFNNTIGELNTLAVYLSTGGKAWLFGDGICPAIGNGFVSRFPGTPFARYPFASTGDAPSTTSILWPGNFIYDFMKARSEIDLNTRGFPSPNKEMVDMLPYLPQYRTPGAAWPPMGEPRGAMDDPRIGPASSRNLGRWDNLPMLTITSEFSDWPNPLPSSLDDISYISLPNFILEDDDDTPVTPKVSKLDTLYIARGRVYIPGFRPDVIDGKPVFLYYWGEDHGPIAWTSVNIWMFERTQLQQLAEVVLGEFGFSKNNNPQTWTGPNSAHRRFPRVVEVP